MIKKILCLLILISVLTIPVSAAIPITVSSVSQDYITWSWPAGTVITSETIDGFLVCNYDPSATTLTLSDLNPNEQHTIKITSATDIGTSTATTLPDTTVYAGLTGTVNTWIYLLFIVLFIFLGYSMRRKPLMRVVFNVLASIISIYALSVWLQENSVQATDIWHIQFFIYGFFFVMGFVLIYIERN